MMRQQRTRAGLVFGGLAAVLASAGLAAAQVTSQKAPSTANPGIYTSEQATRGEPLFREQCATCHREDLAGRKSDGGPMLRGAQFTTKWGHQTVHALFSTMEELMPDRHPGSLTRAQYADVVSYILRMNGVPPGPKPLPVEPEAQRKVKVRFRP